MSSDWRDRVPPEARERAKEYLESLEDEPEPELLPPNPSPVDTPIPYMRVGRHLKVTLYFQFGEEASDNDTFIGHVDSELWADMLCRTWNFARTAWQHGGGNAEDCPICRWDHTIPSPFICKGGPRGE